MATRRTPSQPWIPEIPLSNAASAGLPSAYRAHALAAQDRYQHFARDAALGSLLAQTSAAEAPAPAPAPGGADIRRRLRDWLRTRAPFRRGASPLPATSRGPASFGS